MQEDTFKEIYAKFFPHGSKSIPFVLCLDKFDLIRLDNVLCAKHTMHTMLHIQ